jgi:SIR2-like protein
MLLIIFGAGASYDSWSDKSVSDRSGRIPLADDLFGVHYARFVLKEMRPILPLLRTRPPGVTVEHQLEVLQAEAPRYEARARQLLAVRFYLSQMLIAVEDAWLKETAYVSNYRTLVDELQLLIPQEPVAFVTFNYDTLLERAIESDTIRQFPDVSSYAMPTERWNVFKLHGSLGWSRRVQPPADLPVRRIRRENLIALAPSLRPVDEWSKSAGAFGQSAIPALAVPFESKQDFECPSSHVDQLQSDLGGVDRILSIGWRATDEPFLEMLRTHAGKVRHVETVTMTNPAAPLARLTDVLPPGVEATATAGGFTQFIVNREIRRLFSPLPQE